jgi:O-antigen/teichoic acid export membrane protein
VFLVALWILARGELQYSATDAMILQWFAFVGVTVLAGIAFHLRLAREVRATGREYETRRWIRTAVPLLGAFTFSAYLPEITVVVAGFYLSSLDVGILQVSYRIALLIAFGLYAVDSFTAPEAARLVARTDQKNLQETVDRATRLRFWPALAAVIVLVVAGRPILALFGPEFVSGYAALIILAIAQLTQAAVGPVNRLMMLTGHQDRTLVAAVGALLLLLPLLAVLAPRYGSVGAAVAALIDMVVWSLWMRYLVVKSLNIRPSIF